MLGNRLHGKALACAELSSNTPTMNSIAAETGLHVICLQIEVGHVAGVANCEADALSRQCQGKAFPCQLAEVQRAATPCRKLDFFLAWSGDSLCVAGLVILVPLKRQV
jgi:hypothetical protein